MSTKITDLHTLHDAEDALAKILHRDLSTWRDTATILLRVRDGELFTQSGLTSFTAWVKDFATKQGVHESYLWRLLKAGEIVVRFQANGGDISGVDAINPEAIVIAEKTGRGTSREKELIEAAIHGEMTKAELTAAYREKQRDASLPASGDGGKTAVLDPKKQKKRAATADDILAAIRRDKSWVTSTEHAEIRRRYQPEKYVVLPEFAVPSATTRHAERIDAMIVETITTNDNEVALHAVEFKVDKGDLKHDHKSTDYSLYADYTWYAVPASLLDVATKSLPDLIGLLVLTTSETGETLAVKRAAKRNTPKGRRIALERVIIKLL